MAVRRRVRQRADRAEPIEPIALGVTSGGFDTQSVVQLDMPPGRLGRHLECEGLHEIWISSDIADLDVAYVGRHLRLIHRSLIGDDWDSTVCDAESCAVARIWTVMTDTYAAISS